MVAEESVSQTQNTASFLEKGGEVGALMRAKDWSVTPLGPAETWSPGIKTAVRLCLNSRFPIILWIGPELRILYNDAYIPFLGSAKHPAMLGEPGRVAWGEIWSAISPMHDEVQAGRATWVEDFQMFFARRLPREEVYVTFSYSPIFAEDGQTVEGVFCVCTETTDRVLSERRLSVLHSLGVRGGKPHMADIACREAVNVLADNPLDIPFAVIYLLGDNGIARYVAGTRLPAVRSAFPATHSVANAEHHVWPFAEVARTREAVEISDLPERVGAFNAPLWPDLIQTALVIPLGTPSQPTPAGFLIVGLSPRRVVDAAYRGSLELVAERIATAIANARAFEGERRRAEALTELDRAKTTFFSNVSHEFRTPLTLLMSPLEELLAKPAGELPADARHLIMLSHRNSLRLLKLVNALLDFSRIEAGRARASYQPTDLARLTAELASNFHSACERAGLWLDIACPVLPEPVYVDRDMWEKIVLNLVSNAFKFTFEGGITVHLAATRNGAALRVSDTGIGIPVEELPRIFERFHRIDGRKSRSHEGSGIGLALVQELVRLHGGTITVASEDGQGTTFTVVLPFGTAHLPEERIGGLQTLSATTIRAEAFVEEALRWLPSADDERADVIPRRDDETQEVGAPTDAIAARILLADDNADMREYLGGLLRTRGWEVEAVADGQAALEAAKRRRPDLVLADVMMPRLGGLELAAAMRRESPFADVPIVLLSARAGEEARVEGLEMGADDYLAKPFSARELVARVKSYLALAKLRRDAAERVRQSEARLQAAVNLVGLSPYTWDPVTNTLEWDDRLRAMWGLPPGSHVDVDVFLAGVHPEDRPRVEAAIAACTDPLGDGVYHLTYRVIGIGDGVERWVSTHGQTVFEDNRPLAFIGAALDISNQKLSEERLRVSEERFRQFAEHSSNVIWILDTRTMQLEYLNPVFETVWGQSPEPMLGDYARWGESIHPEDRAHVLDTIGRVRQGEGATIEYRIVRPDGSVRWIRDTVFSVRDEFGSVLRVGGIAQDITIHNSSIVYIVDADETSRQRLMILLQRAGYDVKAFASGRAFLEVVPALMPGCVVLDIGSPETGGTTIPGELKARRIALPVIVTGRSGGDVKIAVQAMKAGAVEWLEMPYEADELLAAIAAAMASTQDTARMDRAAELARARIALMSSREREVLAGVIAGETNKVIGRRLGISPRTVESHRAHVMQQLGARTLPELVLLATAAGIRP